MFAVLRPLCSFEIFLPLKRSFSHINHAASPAFQDVHVGVDVALNGSFCKSAYQSVGFGTLLVWWVRYLLAKHDVGLAEREVLPKLAQRGLEFSGFGGR